MLALAESNFVEGQALLDKSIAIYRETRSNLIGFWLGDLALADYHLNQLSSMRDHLSEMLGKAKTNENVLSAVSALPGIALLLAASGNVVRAIEVWELAQRIPLIANSRYYEDLAWREVAAAADSLPPEIVAAARERGRALDLWATAADLLAFLEEGVVTAGADSCSTGGEGR
jgi:hypothetical protein